MSVYIDFYFYNGLTTLHRVEGGCLTGFIYTVQINYRHQIADMMCILIGKWMHADCRAAETKEYHIH